MAKRGAIILLAGLVGMAGMVLVAPVLLVVPLLAMPVLGAVLVWFGWHGQADFSEPRCVGCGYDLRTANFASGAPGTCPECGADLGQRGAVRFGAHRRRPGLIVAGAALCLPLVLAVPGAALFWVSAGVVSSTTHGPAANQGKPAAQLVTDLATTAGEPWTWQELERRYRAGQLTDAEVAQAIDALIDHLHRQHSRGEAVWPLHWTRTFLGLAIEGDRIDASQFDRLVEAYFGEEPSVRMDSPERRGQRIMFEVDYGGPRDLPGTKLVKHVREIRVNGEAIPLASVTDMLVGTLSDHPGFLSRGRIEGIVVQLTLDLPPGEHEITFVVDVGLLRDNAPLTGPSDRPGPAAGWVDPIHVWEVEQTVTVVATEEEVVTKGGD